MQADKAKIAVVLPNPLGDAVMATPALRALRAGFPDAQISGVVREELVAVVRGAPWLDALVVHAVPAGRGPLGRLARRVALGRRLAGQDRVIVLPNSFAAALVAFVSRAPERLGYDRYKRGRLLTDPAPAPSENGQFQPVAMERYYLDLMRRIGCPDTGTHLELFVELPAERERERRLRDAGIDPGLPLVLIAPGASFGPSKLWPTESFAEVARGLLRDGAQVALVHAPGEEVLAEAIRERAGEGVTSLGGTGMNLSLLKSLVARANLMLCNDAGARHVAAAFRVPCLVLMGPTSPSYTNLNLEHTRVLREPVECSPCQLKVCPIDHRCMTRLTPERVLGEARAALADESWCGDSPRELAQ